jgi:hypothetical protein
MIGLIRAAAYLAQTFDPTYQAPHTHDAAKGGHQ